MADSPTKDRDTASSGPGRYSVIFIISAFAVLALALLPIADRPGPVMPGINTLFVAVIAVTELSTSFLLLVRFRAVRIWSLLFLGCAFFYSALMSIPHLLTFPGAVVADRPLIGTSSQSTSWLYTLWVNGFALLNLISVSIEARFGEWRIAAENVRYAVAIGLGLTASIALTIVFVAIAAPDRLPALVDAHSALRV